MNEYTQLIQIDQIYFKREDTNITGSIKDRGLPHQIEKALEQDATQFVLSSSGNAAISAAKYCTENNLPLTVFVSGTIPTGKMRILQDLSVDIQISQKPLTDSQAFAKEFGAHHLQQSTDANGTVGYRKIATELSDQIQLQQESHIFVPVSSGTAFVGIYEGFQHLLHTQRIKNVPHMHIVQTQAIQPIAGKLDTDFKRKSSSIVDAIVPPMNPPRETQVRDVVQETSGSGWVIMDEEMLAADTWLIEHNITTSYEGALALAGYWKAQKNGYAITQPIIVLTGKRYE